jgi:hypothetical protein
MARRVLRLEATPQEELLDKPSIATFPNEKAW